MKSNRARLDRFISSRMGVNRGDVRLMLAQGRVLVDGGVATEVNQLVDQFCVVIVDGQELQKNLPQYIMMNKPAGVVSATKDAQHTTVIDLLDCQTAEQLHITGRLDFHSSGLILLTNDGRWSRSLTAPEKRVTKLYRVTLEKPLTGEYVAAFAEGMHFAYEGITTLPATLNIISDYVAEVGLVEGRYHQIKRMFGRFQNRVLTLHRTSIGNVRLDPTLSPGQSRVLTPGEIRKISSDL